MDSLTVRPQSRNTKNTYEEHEGQEELLTENGPDPNLFLDSASTISTVSRAGPALVARPGVAQPHADTSGLVHGRFVAQTDTSTHALAALSANPPVPRQRTDSHTPVPTLPAPPHRRYWILTAAGKPVYASDPADEEQMTTYVGVMQAIISIFADDGDRIRTIRSGNSQIVFLLRPPLYLVAASEWGDPDSILRSHLDYLYLQLLSVLTKTQLQRIFANRDNFDLRRLIDGSDKLFNTLISSLQTDFPLSIGCLQVCRMDPALRDECSNVLSSNIKEKKLLYAVLIAGGRLVTLLRPRRHSVYPADVHLILNTVLSSTHSSSSSSMPVADTWMPICLPKYNSSGFLHAYITFISKRVGMILVGPDRDAFTDMQLVKDKVADKLHSTPLLGQLEDAAREHDYHPKHVSGAPGVRHFAYKSKANLQVTCPMWEGDYEDDNRQRGLLSIYHKAYEMLHRKPPVKVVYLRSEHEAVLAWATSTFELFLGVSPLLPKATAIKSAHAVSRWVKAEEKRLFLLGSPSF